MSVIFFDVDELANVGALLCKQAWGGVSQQCDEAAGWLAAFSEVNARAYGKRYPKESATAWTKKDLYDAIYARYSRPADAKRAWGTTSLMRYNCAEAEPTANELNVICHILERVGRAIVGNE